MKWTCWDLRYPKADKCEDIPLINLTTGKSRQRETAQLSSWSVAHYYFSHIRSSATLFLSRSHKTCILRLAVTLHSSLFLLLDFILLVYLTLLVLLFCLSCSAGIRRTPFLRNSKKQEGFCLWQVILTIPTCDANRFLFLSLYLVRQNLSLHVHYPEVLVLARGCTTTS